jgi:hypothetical protein
MFRFLQELKKPSFTSYKTTGVIKVPDPCISIFTEDANIKYSNTNDTKYVIIFLFTSINCYYGSKLFTFLKHIFLVFW